MKRLFTILTLSFLYLYAAGQKNEGYIRFSMQYSDSELSKEERAALPSESEIWFKEDRMKMMMPMGMGLQSSVLINNDQVHLLLDMMGNKMAIKTSRKEMQADVKTAKRFKLKSRTDDTKEIAGYTCKKAIMSSEGEQDMIVWFTDQISAKSIWYYNMEGINGFPLEFSLKTPEIDARMIAKEVRLGAVEEQQFIIPDGYKVMTQEEMMKSLGVSR